MMSPLVVSILTLVVSSGLLASWRGGPPERLAAAIIVGWVLTDALYHVLFGPSGFEEVDPVHLVLDGAELVAITWLALQANRMWPMWAAAAQLICVTGHLAAFVEPVAVRRAYWAMTQLPQYIQLTALLLGAFAHARRVRRFGPYRSWRVPKAAPAPAFIASRHNPPGRIDRP
ncbi:MAG: hypothetical protein B7Z08_05900 [Sphingomonadales bacterium 32-68-7]|nr:MAG: hypothetical protein B7Z33_11150 [Sphingomonadales bacterium 12-68-11]OYX09275.1 MAG: hypothetical protein B7Z08_05900 [Sphingomonadales bacterium 32-68-7]